MSKWGLSQECKLFCYFKINIFQKENKGDHINSCTKSTLIRDKIKTQHTRSRKGTYSYEKPTHTILSTEHLF